MMIAKDLQSRDYTSEELAHKYMVSERTIQADRGALVNGIQVLGENLKIDRMKLHEKDMLISTVHPLFLASNLTQIVTMMEGLKTMGNHPAYRSYSESAAVDIWRQLSPYAKDRIKNVLVELLSLDAEWYEALEKGEKHRGSNMFMSERNCRSGISGRADINGLLYTFKAGAPCSIAYKNDNNETVDTGSVYIHSFTEKIVTVSNEKRNYSGSTKIQSMKANSSIMEPSESKEKVKVNRNAQEKLREDEDDLDSVNEPVTLVIPLESILDIIVEEK